MADETEYRRTEETETFELTQCRRRTRRNSRYLALQVGEEEKMKMRKTEDTTEEEEEEVDELKEIEEELKGSNRRRS